MMQDEGTDAASIDIDEPETDILYEYQQKLLYEEQITELRQQLDDKDQEIEELNTRLQCTTDELKLSIQQISDAEKQVCTSL